MHYEITFSLCALWWCLIGNTYSISNRPPANKPANQVPDRRFYFYNPDILPNAAAALGMVVPQTFYKPMLPHLGPSLAPVHFADYGEEEEDIYEHEHEQEHEEKQPIQLFTIVKPPKSSKHGHKKKKKKKGHQHHQHKPLKQFKRLVKKCLPFKVRIIKKSDIDNNDNQFYQNIRSQLPYGYGDEYFPQPPEKQELAVISLNTSNISENGDRFPQVLHFLYPRYNMQQARPKQKFPPQPQSKKRYRFARPPAKNAVRPFRVQPKRPWPKINPWRVVPAGRPVSEYPLKEPTPDAVGGSPPPSPIIALQKDPRIPVSQAYIEDQQTESPPNYANVQLTTPTQIQYYQEQWAKPTGEADSNFNSYSNPDYYRYGIYDQNQFYQHNPEGYVPENHADQESQYSSNYNTISHSYYNYATTSEKVATVTPTTSWVPIPQLQRAPQPSKVNENSYNPPNTASLENKRVSYMSGGFKNLSSHYEKDSNSYNFGDKIVATRNCTISRNGSSLQNNCYEEKYNRKENKEVSRITTVRPRGGLKYHNKQNNNASGKGSAKYSSQHSIQHKKYTNSKLNTINGAKARLYVKENAANQNMTNFKIILKQNSTNLKGRSYSTELENKTEIVTALYRQDDLNEIYKNVSPGNSSSVRSRRSNFKGFSAVVSGSMLVEDN